ncbi:MAG: recombinase family protein [Oligoflexus sp.]|nr:recombinase family protein [Oligoflexus sp.]
MSTVCKHLKKYGIPLRESGQNIRPKRHLAFGKKIVGKSVEAHKREQEVLEQISELRAQGHSYWKIAVILNTLKVRTKTGRGKWHARSVQQILDRVSLKP